MAILAEVDVDYGSVYRRVICKNESSANSINGPGHQVTEVSELIDDHPCYEDLIINNEERELRRVICSLCQGQLQCALKVTECSPNVAYQCARIT